MSDSHTSPSLGKANGHANGHHFPAAALTAEEIANRLGKARRSGNGWTVNCPCHDDKKASLTIAPGDKTPVVVHCHGPCTQPQIIAALRDRGLWADAPMPAPATPTSRIVATYDYRDSDGTLLFQAVRKDPKEFRQRRPNGSGWIWDLRGVKLVPYRLPELLAAAPGSTIFIPEGEKDCDGLYKRGLTASCNPMGAGKWRAEFAPYFAGHHVVVLSDFDPQSTRKDPKHPDGPAIPLWHPDGRPVLPGQDHAASVATSLHSVAASVRVFTMPDGHKDVSDWLAAGGKVEDLERLTREAPLWLPDSRKSKADALADADADADGAAMLRYLTAETWKMRNIPPADRLLGDLVTTTSRIFLVGRTGIGKTMLGHAMACGIATGKGFGHWRSSRPARVLYIDGEMPAELIKARCVDLLRRGGTPPTNNLLIFARDTEEEFAAAFPSLGLMPPLNTEAGCNYIATLIDILKPDVIFFDNVMSLITGDQREEVPWSETLPLVMLLTRRRVGQVWLDHTGHSVERQYGSSTKGWRMDAIGAALPLPDDERGKDDLAFKLSFEHPGKARRRTPENRSDFETVIIRLRDDEWTVEPANAGAGLGKVPPSRLVFHDALTAAIGKSAGPSGETTVAAWESECLRRSLIEPPPPDWEETPTQRGKRYLNYRRAKGELLGAGWIAIDDTRVIDLKGRWA